MDKAVVNASPFILLSKTGLVDLLSETFKEVLMPQGVAAEIGFGNDVASDRLASAKSNWLGLAPTSLEPDVEIWNLGVGETEVLSYAFGHREFLAVVDDRAARRCAETLDIKCLGTVGLLVTFKKRGLIEGVAQEVKALELAGLYLSDSIKAAVLNEAGESAI